jgi:hypothetical protein
LLKLLDWMRVSTMDIGILGGKGLLDQYYSGNLLSALKIVYPGRNLKMKNLFQEHNWKMEKYTLVQKKTEARVGSFVEEILNHNQKNKN